MKTGLDLGEKCVYVLEENTEDMTISRMKAAGMDVETAVASGKLTFQDEREVYLKHGYFDPVQLLSVLKASMDEVKAAGFSALRIAGGITRALCGYPGAERLMEYEAKLNYFFPENEALAICLYNRKGCAPGIIKNVLSTHPLVISGGVVCHNFYYVPPDDFLGEEEPDKQIDRLLSTIRETAEDELRRQWEHSEELVGLRREEETLNRLNEQLKQLVSERAGELERRNHELEEMIRAFVGRELRMAELKERIEKLEKQNSEFKKAEEQIREG